MSDDETQERLLLLTAALFAVRLFRRDEDSFVSLSPEQRASFETGEAMLRAEAAERSARDAAAILAAVGKVWV